MARSKAGLFVALLYVVFGLLELIPPTHTRRPAEDPPLIIQNASGYLFGVFPNNLVLTCMHLATGVTGLIVYWYALNHKTYLAGSAVFYALVAVIGAFSTFEGIYKYLPLFGGNVWLHTALALTALLLYLLPIRRSRTLHQRPRERRVLPGQDEKRVLPVPPVHSLVVPLPIGCFFGVLVTDLAYWWTTIPWYNGSEAFWPQVSFWLLASGLVTGLAAAILGITDLFCGNLRTRAGSTCKAHVVGSAALLAVGGLNLALRIGEHGARIIPWGLIVSTNMVILLAIAIASGAQLAYRYRVHSLDQPTYNDR